MGIDNTTYIGPFLKIKDTKVKTISSIKSCPKTTCIKHEENVPSDFCPRCGTKTESLSVSKEVSKVNLIEVLVDETNEALYGISHNENNYVLPNLNRNRPRDFYVYNYEFKAETNLNKEEEIKWFLEAFEGEINVIKSKYDPEEVEVLWGVIAYQS